MASCPIHCSEQTQPNVIIIVWEGGSLGRREFGKEGVWEGGSLEKRDEVIGLASTLDEAHVEVHAYSSLYI